MSDPIRIRLSRAKGFKLADASPDKRKVINVSRPSAWGNPFVVGKHGNAAECVALHRALIRTGPSLAFPINLPAQWKAIRHHQAHMLDLQNCHVACWCPLDAPCHGDTLLSTGRALKRVARRMEAIERAKIIERNQNNL